ncbi:MAG: glycosyltransferase family 4 protein [Ignavibacteriales bacterium]|nr:glycosyltransferase family 4 protein [Ignavibacteriales bacterium]
MKIAIDARVLNKGITGTGRYLMNILDGLQKEPTRHDFYLLTSNKDLFKKSIFKVMAIKEFGYLDKIYSPFWLNIILPKLLKEMNFDVYFTTNILVPIVNLSRVKKISVVHDVIHKVHKEYYPLLYRAYLDFFLPFSLKKSDKIITVSEYSKRDIIQYYGITEGKISVVPANVATNFRPIDRENSILQEKISYKYSLPKQFMLFVGSIEKRKNIISLIKIAVELNNKGIDLPLILIGKPGYGFEECKKFIDKNYRFVRYLDFVNDNDLVYLYNKALVFVFPSLYEGFGIPPLEAMQCGTPVIASNTSSLPEVIGDGGILLDPDDISAFVNEIMKLYNNKDYYYEWKSKGLERSKKFSIKGTAQKLIEQFDNFEN